MLFLHVFVHPGMPHVLRILLVGTSAIRVIKRVWICCGLLEGIVMVRVAWVLVCFVLWSSVAVIVLGVIELILFLLVIFCEGLCIVLPPLT